MERFGGLLLIDTIVKIYPAYDHEAVFRMETDFAYNLLLINRTDAKIEADANTLRKLQKK